VKENHVYSDVFEKPASTDQWRFYVGARGAQAPNLAQAPQILSG